MNRRLFLELSIVTVTIAVFLSIGTVIYYSSGETLRGLIWLEQYANAVHHYFIELSSQLPNVMTSKLSRYYVPDFCWSFSIALLVVWIWVRDLKPLYCYSLAIVVATSYELSQFLKIMPGIFDMLDVVISIFAGVLACKFAIIVSNTSKTTKQEKQK